MVKCDFCGDHIPAGKGKKFVKTDGKTLDLCSTKCHKNMFKLKRKPRTTRWTEEYNRVKKGMKN